MNDDFEMYDEIELNAGHDSFNPPSKPNGSLEDGKTDSHVINVWERSEDETIYTRVKFAQNGDIHFEEENEDWNFSDMVGSPPAPTFKRYVVPAERRLEFISSMLGPDEEDNGQTTLDRLTGELAKRLQTTGIRGLLQGAGFA